MKTNELDHVDAGRGGDRHRPVHAVQLLLIDLPEGRPGPRPSLGPPSRLTVDARLAYKISYLIEEHDVDVGTGSTQITEQVLSRLDLERAVGLVQEVCRIPSVLGDEGPLADVPRVGDAGCGFEGVELQPVLPDRPNADRGGARSGRAARRARPATWTPSPSPTAGT